MSKRTMMLVGLALAFGIATATAVHFAVQQIRSLPSPVETIPIVVTTSDVPRFTTISKNQLALKDWPRNYVPIGTAMTVEEVVGRVAIVPMVKGDLVLETKIAGREAGRGISPGIEKGKRAFTIQTPNVASSVAGFILPGNKVDVLLTVTGQGINDGGGTTLTLLQAVEILAVDQRLEAPSDNKVDTKDLRSVTLLVTPEEMVKLDLGQNKGTLHLALRHLEDKAIVAPTKATLHTIGLLPPPPEPKREDQSQDQPPVEKKQNSEPPPPLLIRTIRGNQEGGVLIYPSDR